MASSSDPFARRVERHVRVAPPEPAGRSASGPGHHARFIPREELGQVAAWVPGQLDGSGAGQGFQPAPTAPTPKPAAAPAAPALSPEELARRQAEQARRQQALDHAFARGRAQGQEEGRQQALDESQKVMDELVQRQAREVGEPMAAVLAELQQQLDGLEQSLARRVAGIAMQMARQVVRAELAAPAAMVVAVTQEALGEVLLSARHITVRLNPADLALVEAGCADRISARGAALLADAHIERGGCLVESDLGVVDARVSTRWQRAVAAAGLQGFDQDTALDAMA